MMMENWIKKYRKLIVFITLLLIISVVVSIFISIKKKKNYEEVTDNKSEIENSMEEYITRFEWIQLLCNNMGIKEYDQLEPYFQDVAKDSEFFDFVQAAIEDGIIDKTEKFEGDKPATGYFIALTSIRTIGEKKLQIIYNLTDEMTDKMAVQLAVDKGLVYQQELESEVIRERSYKILDKLQELYFGDFWIKNYEMVTYQEGVISVDGSDLSEIIQKVDEGSIVVHKNPNTELRTAFKVMDKLEDGSLVIDNQLKLEEIYSYIAVSDMKEVTFEDIINSYQFEDNTRIVDSSYNDKFEVQNMKTKVFNDVSESKGFEISLFTADEKLKASIKNNDTGDKEEIVLKDDITVNGDCNATIDVKRLVIAAQGKYRSITNWEYVEIAIDAETDISGKIAVKGNVVQKKIPLFKVPVKLAKGTASIDIQTFIIITASGEVSFGAEIPMGVAVRYEPGKKVRYFNPELSVQNAELKVNCEAEGFVRFEPQLKVAELFNVLDAEVDIGIGAKAESILRLDGSECIDVSVALPIIKVGLCKDEKFGAIIGKLGVSKEWTLKSFEDTLYRKNLHYEIKSDKTMGFVDGCTFKDSDKSIMQEVFSEKKNKNKIKLNNTYMTQFGDIKFSFDYPDDWTISEATSNEGFVEELMLEDKFGTVIYYYQYKIFPLGGYGHASFASGKIKETEKSLIDGLVIGKLEITESEDPMTGEVFKIDDAPPYYALFPNSKIGQEVGMMGLSGVLEECSFEYGNNRYTFMADFQNESSEEEVIAILSSFRIVE